MSGWPCGRSGVILTLLPNEETAACEHAETRPAFVRALPRDALGHGQVVIDQATGFLFRSKQSDRLHSITNWQVVTGRNPDKPTETRTAAIPKVLRCLLHARGQHVHVRHLASKCP